MPDTAAYLIIGGCAAGTTFVLTPLVCKVANRLDWVVQPDDRRVHKVPTPDVGGIAMFIGFVAALTLSRLMNSFDSLYSRNSEPRGVLIAAVIMFAVGLLDDVRNISAPAKVFGTVLAGIALVYYGVTMFYFRVPRVDVITLADEWIPLVTIIWLLGMSQAINLIDGLDGLAAGIVAIASGAFFLYSTELQNKGLLTRDSIAPLVCIISVGICLGFMPHNFNPAKIFMGDSGALLLGLLMASATSVVGGRADPVTQQQFGQSYFFFAPLFIPLFILGVPIFDTLFAIVRRATRGQGLATADKGHLHHRLMNLGHGQRRSVLILWLWTALLSAFVLYPVFTTGGATLATLGVMALGLGLFTVLHPEVRRTRAKQATNDAGELENSDSRR